MDEGKTPNYYAIIPADVRYDKELTSSAKLLYGEIVALSNKEGYCWASNGYFAKLYGKNPTWISVTFRMLAERGYIKIELLNNNRRKIWIAGPRGVLEKTKGGIRKNIRGVLEKTKGGVLSKPNGSKTEQEKLDSNIIKNNSITNDLPLETKGISKGLSKTVKEDTAKRDSSPLGSWFHQGLSSEDVVASRFPQAYRRFKKKTPAEYNSNNLLILFCIEFYKKYKMMYSPSGNGASPFGGKDSSNLKVLLTGQSPEIMTKVIPYFIRNYEKIESLPNDRPAVSILYGWRNTVIPNCLLGEPKGSEAERGRRGEITEEEWEEDEKFTGSSRKL